MKLRSILISGVEKFPKDTNLTVSLAENYNDAKEWSHAVQVIKDGLPYAKDNFYKKLLLTVLKNSYVGLNQLKEAAEVEQQLSELK